MPGLTLNFPIKPGPPASTEEDVRMMKNYLFRLTEQLQYLFDNLGVENLTQDAIGQLTGTTGGAMDARLNSRLAAYKDSQQTEDYVFDTINELVTTGRYQYFKIDANGVYIGNIQLTYDPAKGLLVWPYEWEG